VVDHPRDGADQEEEGAGAQGGGPGEPGHAPSVAPYGRVRNRSVGRRDVLGP
jgi:hypothetical protein